MADGLGNFDLSNFFEKDIDRMEERYTGAYLYKYYGEARRGFFEKPEIRFTVKNSLNDPFELTKRWDEVCSENTADFMKEYILRCIDENIKNRDYISSFIKENYTFPDGMSSRNKNRLSKRLVDDYFRSGGDGLARGVIEDKIPLVAEALLSIVPKSIEKIIGSIGIFSTSESYDNAQLWGLYADSGRGFVVELRIEHEFFQVAGENKNIFRKVFYTDLRTREFVRNPYYLFLVKDERWAFEREWRAVNSIEHCDIEVAPGVHLWRLPVGSISSIIFGYQYNEDTINIDVERIKKFDGEIVTLRAVVDEESHIIRAIPFDSI